jgi:hypothetical protein
MSTGSLVTTALRAFRHRKEKTASGYWAEGHQGIYRRSNLRQRAAIVVLIYGTFNNATESRVVG